MFFGLKSLLAGRVVHGETLPGLFGGGGLAEIGLDAAEKRDRFIRLAHFSIEIAKVDGGPTPALRLDLVLENLLVFESGSQIIVEVLLLFF